MIRVAIAGGGIAGLCLARGLLQYPQFDVQVYESVSQYGDRGGGLALHANAIRAMELIDPIIKQIYFRKANSMLEDDETEMATQVIMAQGRYQGEVIAQLGRAKGRKTVSRADLLEGFAEMIPRERLHMKKRLVGVEEELDSGVVVLSFADGSAVTADCLIGADGIHSVTRQYVLGKDHPAALPVNHDHWYRVGAKLPTELVRKTLSPRFQGFVPILCGPNGVFTMLPIHFGKTTTLNWMMRAKTSADMGRLPVPQDFEEYPPDCVKMAELILQHNAPEEARSLYDHDPAPFYHRQNVVMIGDAAHATFPFVGNGAAQAIEDGAVLHALFAHVKDKAHLALAFASFDEVRRPRAQRVVEISRTAGMVYTYDFAGFFWDEDESDGIEALREQWRKLASFTNDADLVTQNEQAIDAFYGRIMLREVNGDTH